MIPDKIEPPTAIRIRESKGTSAYFFSMSHIAKNATMIIIGIIKAKRFIRDTSFFSLSLPYEAEVNGGF